MFVDNPVGLEVNGSLWTLALRIRDVSDGAGARRAAAVAPGRSASRCLALGMACIVFPARSASSAAGAGLLCFFAIGMVLYKLRDTRIFNGWLALARARRPRAQHPAAAVHPALPALRLLSRALARAQSEAAAHPGGALRRSLLRALHLSAGRRSRSRSGCSTATPRGGRSSCSRLCSPAASPSCPGTSSSSRALRFKPRSAWQERAVAGIMRDAWRPKSLSAATSPSNTAAPRR